MLSLINALGKATEGFVDVTAYETTSTYRSSTVEVAIAILDDVPGMTPCRTSLFKHSSLRFLLQDGSQLRTWTNRAVGGDHVFLADPNGGMLYGGFVWAHAQELRNAIDQIKTELT
ncbi:hypothetical protein QGP82_26820 [Leptothoe sp. LEGE 181152]|nr:hypothetical protein [Leptothoe sp. LEGE 181152]